MVETLLVYAAWVALATGVVASIVITQSAIRQLLQDSAEGSPGSHDESEHLDVPPVERHV